RRDAQRRSNLDGRSHPARDCVASLAMTLPSAATAMTPLLAVDGIHTYYGKSHILDGISLEVGPGEVVGLLGRNGVGKSTTLKAIAGLVGQADGQMHLDRDEVNHLAVTRIDRHS